MGGCAKSSDAALQIDDRHRESRKLGGKLPLGQRQNTIHDTNVSLDTVNFENDNSTMGSQIDLEKINSMVQEKKDKYDFQLK